jgi:hypothetical protein
MATSEPFTKADVDYLVDATKFIKFIPFSPKGKGNVMPEKIQLQANVFKKSEARKPVAGLVIKATVRKSPPVPKPNPSCALEWYEYAFAD